MFSIGTIIANRYKIIKQIGKGGTSEVYLVRHLGLDIDMAMKAIKSSENVQQDFSVEAHILKDLRHSNLPRVIDILEYENMLCIIRDYIKGQTLQVYIESIGPLDEHKIKLFVAQVADVLNYLHTQPTPIVYRDLKPSNLIVDADEKLFLIDFGTTRKYNSQNDSDTLYLGTRGYAAPEQFGGTQSDARTDVYALGATLYFMYTGEHYYEVPSEYKWHKFKSQSSLHVKFIIEKAMHVMPDARYQSIALMVENLKIIISAKDETFSRTVTNSYNSQKRIVALMGATKGCGVTHLGLAIARCCSIRIKETLYLERIQDRGINMLERAIEGADLSDVFSTRHYKYSGIRFLKETSEQDFLQALSLQAQSAIIDYGTHHHMIQDFLRAPIKVFVLPANPWALGNYGVLEALKNYDDIHFFVNLSDGKALTTISDWYQIKKNRLTAIGYQPNPLVYGESHKVYDVLLGFKEQKRFLKLSWRK